MLDVCASRTRPDADLSPQRGMLHHLVERMGAEPLEGGVIPFDAEEGCTVM